MLIKDFEHTTDSSRITGSGGLDLAIVFGGKSSEYAVSLVSASFIIEICESIANLRIHKIGITREGAWYLTQAGAQDIADDKWQEHSKAPISWRLDALDQGYYIGDWDLLTTKFTTDGEADSNVVKESIKFCHLDCIFPVLHGRNGEDGTVQGLWQLAGIPYVGCQVVDSAVAMDKVISFMLFDHAGIPQTKWTWLRQRRFLHKQEQSLQEIESKISYPMFVKPANAGSSVGISKVKERSELIEALHLAFEHDCKVVIEEAVNAREVEFAVLQLNDRDESIFVSEPGEIIPEREFYDYQAKYQDAHSRLVIPAEISAEQKQIMEEYAKLAFRTVDAHGLCRVDFFIDKDSGQVLLNEINTLPGFTGISMYPKLMQASGIEAQNLIVALINKALS